MNKEERDRIEGNLDPNRGFIMPADMTDNMRNEAYIEYCNLSKKGYMAWDDICKIFVAAFKVK